MTKRNMGLVQSYERATATGLYDVYGRPSERKQAAFRHCIAEMLMVKGYDARICSANCNFFTFAYRFISNTDGKEHLMYKTGRNDYDIVLE